MGKALPAMVAGLRTLLPALHERAERLAVRVRPHLPKLVGGLLAVGLACFEPAALAAPATPRLIGAVTTPGSASGAFLGSDEPGRVGVESSALALAAATGGLPAGGSSLGPWIRQGGALVATDRCPPSALAVSWVPPVGDHRVGAYVAPLGPAPDEHTKTVNGVVVCRTSDYAYLGFEAAWDGHHWLLSAVPSLAEETDAPLLEGEAEAEGSAPAVAGTDAGAGPPALPNPAEWDGAPLEPPAVYVPQTTCDPTAKPGVLGFRDLLLTTFPGSRNLGIGRVCEAEGVSEHKEGRGFDWGVAATDPGERAAAETVLTWLLAPDDHGEPFAMARRLGLMYVIWDGQIWSAFRANEGWRPYVGVSEHRDHVHFSFDWPGAMGQTSFWQGGSARLAGSAIPDLPLVPVTPRNPALPLGGLPPGAVLPPIPLPPGLVAPSSSSSSGDEPPPESTTTTSTTTTTSPPPESTTTTSPPPSTTTTTSPPLTFPPPPTTLRLGSL